MKLSNFKFTNGLIIITLLCVATYSSAMRKTLSLEEQEEERALQLALEESVRLQEAEEEKESQEYHRMIEISKKSAEDEQGKREAQQRRACAAHPTVPSSAAAASRQQQSQRQAPIPQEEKLDAETERQLAEISETYKQKEDADLRKALQQSQLEEEERRQQKQAPERKKQQAAPAAAAASSSAASSQQQQPAVPAIKIERIKVAPQYPEDLQIRFDWYMQNQPEILTNLEAFCGYHALFNAHTLLEWALGRINRPARDELLQSFIRQNGRRDEMARMLNNKESINDGDIKKLINKLNYPRDQYSVIEELPPLRTNSLNDFYGPTQGQEFSSELISVLKELRKNQPRRYAHAFIVGNMDQAAGKGFGHWLTFVVVKEGNKLTYYWADSVENNKQTTVPYQEVIAKFRNLIETIRIN